MFMLTTGIQARFSLPTCMKTTQLPVVLQGKTGYDFQPHSRIRTSQRVSIGTGGMKTCWPFASMTKRKYISYQLFTRPMSSTQESLDRQGNVVRKLKLIDDYNRYMGDVDRNDEMIGTYSCVRKSMKWTKTVAFHFIEEGILNGHILFKKEGGTKQLFRFKLDCINNLFATFASEPTAPEASDRFLGRHFPELIPPTNSKQNPQKRCGVYQSGQKEGEQIPV